LPPLISRAKLAYPNVALSAWYRFNKRCRAMWLKRILAVATGTVAIVLLVTLGPFSGVREIAHESTRLHLGYFGSSIYEYHEATGNWPTQIGDLALTSLPAKSPYWKTILDDEVDVIVWHKTLKPDPKDNAGHILVYHNKGLISKRGQSWVCWGDLRTEYIKTEYLRAYLKSLKD
jgi:hypothetical protein